MRRKFEDEFALVQAGYEFCQRCQLLPQQCCSNKEQENVKTKTYFNGTIALDLSLSCNSSLDTESSFITFSENDTANSIEGFEIAHDEKVDGNPSMAELPLSQNGSDDMVIFAERVCTDAFNRRKRCEIAESIIFDDVSASSPIENRHFDFTNSYQIEKNDEIPENNLSLKNNVTTPLISDVKPETKTNININDEEFSDKKSKQSPLLNHFNKTRAHTIATHNVHQKSPLMGDACDKRRAYTMNDILSRSNNNKSKSSCFFNIFSNSTRRQSSGYEINPGVIVISGNENNISSNVPNNDMVEITKHRKKGIFNTKKSDTISNNQRSSLSVVTETNTKSCSCSDDRKPKKVSLLTKHFKLSGAHKHSPNKLSGVSKHSPSKLSGVSKYSPNKNNEKRSRSKTFAEIRNINDLNKSRSKSMTDVFYANTNAEMKRGHFANLRDLRRNAVFEQSVEERFGLSLCLKDYIVNKHLDQYF